MTNCTSQKITLINFVMTILIVFLHGIFEPEQSTVCITKFYRIMTAIGDMAVPTFLVISSFLYFSKINVGNYFLQIRKRIFSLVVPYFIWSLLFYLFYLFLSKIPFIATKLNYNYVVFSLKEGIKAIVFSEYIPQFWYIRILFFLNIVSIIYYIIMNKFGKFVSFVIVIITYLINLKYDFGYSTMIYWLPLFWLVGWFTFFYGSNVERIINKKNNKVSILAITFTGIFSTVVAQYDYHSSVYYLWRNCAPFLIIFIFCWIDKIELKDYYRSSFFIYALHYFFIAMFRKALLLLLGNSPTLFLVEYFITVILSIICSMMVAKIVRTYMPHLCKILTGSRG